MFRLYFFFAMAQSVERAIGQEVVGSILAVATRSLLVGSVSVWPAEKEKIVCHLCENLHSSS